MDTNGRSSTFMCRRVKGRCRLLYGCTAGHGRGGSKDRTPTIALLGKGYVVASINYRLSQHAAVPCPDSGLPGGHPLAARQCREIQNRSAAHRRVGRIRRRHLVALLGTAGDTTAWEPIGEHRDQSAKVQAVIDWFGPADFMFYRPILDRPDNTIRQLIGETNGDEDARLKAASPVTYASADDPPFLIMHGDEDPTVNIRHSQRLLEVLKEKGVDAELVTLAGAKHGGAEFISDASRAKIEGFFAKYLKPEVHG